MSQTPTDWKELCEAIRDKFASAGIHVPADISPLPSFAGLDDESSLLVSNADIALASLTHCFVHAAALISEHSSGKPSLERVSRATQLLTAHAMALIPASGLDVQRLLVCATSERNLHTGVPLFQLHNAAIAIRSNNTKTFGATLGVAVAACFGRMESIRAGAFFDMVSEFLLINPDVLKNDCRSLT